MKQEQKMDKRQLKQTTRKLFIRIAAASISFISLRRGQRELIIADGFVFSQITPETGAHCILEDWNTGRLEEYCNTWILDDWKTGFLEYWWNTGILDYWKPVFLENWWNTGTLVYHQGCPVGRIRPTPGGLHHPSPQNHKLDSPLLSQKSPLLTDHKLRILYIPRFIGDSGGPFALPIRKLWLKKVIVQYVTPERYFHLCGIIIPPNATFCTKSKSFLHWN